MGPGIKSVLTIGVSASVLSLTLLTGSASAAGPDTREICVTGSACFYETPFEGRTSWHADPGADCVTLPFPAYGVFNLTDKRLDMYANADCTGDVLSEPANDFHTWKSRAPRLSFRAV
ncbi:hypothetical protein [Streptomyces albireticuli]|uniref:Peptidase inhibitor family I36 n=1 Tax=Streptomyces albireticuli TaxID=1940 RepID=A0A2A2D690_9ACTN|nr:hypothetical protein [Streptomyces albireticuli]MCD9195152.1 hypothetical protein [Streptomyces albireticuli]PAU47034.1 hypothetical protein CK936_20735 [Streptomyces albireticuli]